MPKIVSAAGTIRARLITPGQGSSGYYTPALLEKSAAKFDGAQCYWDHPTSTEESTRPERSLRDLAGKLIPGTTKWEPSGKEGPGIYSDVQVFQPYHEAINELGPHIGMSIRASGSAKQTTIDGKSTLAIQNIDRVESVDFVTLPGRGGKILQLFEAARGAHTPPKEGAIEMTDAEGKKLQESIDAQAVLIKTQTEAFDKQALENRRFRERFALQDAAGVLQTYFGTVSVADGIRERVTVRLLSGTVPLTEAGDLDKDKLTKIVEAETKDEAAYIAKLSGGKIVTGMGQASAELTEAQKTEAAKATAEELNRSAGTFGLATETGKKIFNEGRKAFDPTYNARLKEVA